MPADDWMLAQGTVDFRDEERRARNEAIPWPEHTPDDLIPDSPLFCLRDNNCHAVIHMDDCPVEIALRDEFGY